jgi:nicotinamide-nucleotide amidase
MTPSHETTPQVSSHSVQITRLAELLLNRQWRLVTAESCTGGMISAACTDLAGSSAWFERGFVTYSNDAKMELLGVEHIAALGAVAQCMVHDHQRQHGLKQWAWRECPRRGRGGLW